MIRIRAFGAHRVSAGSRVRPWLSSTRVDGGTLVESRTAAARVRRQDAAEAARLAERRLPVDGDDATGLDMVAGCEFVDDRIREDEPFLDALKEERRP